MQGKQTMVNTVARPILAFNVGSVNKDLSQKFKDKQEAG
jgi:hypothetical protein